MTSHLNHTSKNRLHTLGITPLTTTEALAAFDLAVAGRDPVLVPAQLDLAQLRNRASAGTLPAIYQGLAGQPGQRKAAGRAGGEAALRAQLEQAGPERARPLLLAAVREHAAQVLGHGSAAAIDPDRGFLDAGFDSLTAVDLRNLLATATGLRLSPTLMFDYPTPAALAGFLHAELAPAAPRGPHQVFAQLDDIEAGLAGLAADTRTKLAARLQDFVLRLGTAPAPAAEGGPAPGESIESATDEEIFALLDKEIGFPDHSS
jgi:acyl carrier protein